MHTILGAGGAIGVELVSELAKKGRRIRLVSRNPKPAAGADQVVSADLADLDQTIKAAFHTYCLRGGYPENARHQTSCTANSERTVGT